MNNQNQSSRRKFLQQIGATSLLAAASPLSSLAAKEKAEERILRYERKFSPNDKVRLGVIGFGVQGHFDLREMLKVPGVELAGICDLYTGRIENAKELLSAGEIGKLNMVNAVYDRQSSIGAWEYTIAADASPETLDWNKYVE